MNVQTCDEIIFDITLWSSGGSSIMRVSPEGVTLNLSPEFFNKRLVWGADKIKKEQWRYNMDQVVKEIEELGTKWGLL